ncbi:MAG: hypothetical protein CMO81_07925 [Waddliaceae bacterium]|nr:hypothetical protein [Waddliaceae bacterium]
MGSETTPSCLIEAITCLLPILEDTDQVFLLATNEVIAELKPQFQANPSLEWLVADQFIAMSELPLQAIRQKPQSSTALGISLLKEQKADVFVSMGNTGALIAQSVIDLRCFSKIHRPALIATIPSKSGPVVVLDVGAQAVAKPEHYQQFAVLGAIYYQLRYAKDSSDISVGLLNMGTEEEKGTKEVVEAYEALADLFLEQPLKNVQFKGNVEGTQVFEGEVQVLVTNGFTGNVFLKTAEGVGSFLSKRLKKLINEEQDTCSERFLQKIKNMTKALDQAEYPGAILCGVNGMVMKCHGSSDSKALYSGLKEAVFLAKTNLHAKIQEAVEEFYRSK